MVHDDAKKKFNQLRIITKYGITGYTFIWTAHCGMLYLGYDLFAVHFSACILALWLGISLSKVYNMCLVHRVSVVYFCLVLICIVMRRHGVFCKLGIELSSARLFMFIVGSVISILSIWKIIAQKNS